MTRTNIFTASLGALLLAASLPALAQDDLRIGFVNVAALLQNAPQTQAVNQQLMSEFAPADADLQTAVEEYQERVETYERDASVMGEAERVALERELAQSERDLQRQQQTLQEDIELRRDELLSDLQATLGDQIRRYAEAEGYDLIVSNVVYVSERIDITEDVLEAISADASE